jgi:hypothetical protein
MKIRRALILAVSIASLLSGCTTPGDEAHLERLMRHRSWPRIEQIAKTEVEKREKLLGWPDNASYLPMEHQDKVWDVMAMTGTPNGDVQRVITLMIGDDGDVLAYQRLSPDGKPWPSEGLR